MLGRPQLFINGGWVAPVQKGTLNVVSPASEKVIGLVGAATASDVDAAVTAARTAFKSWKRTTGEERAVVLRSIAQGVRDRKEELAALETADCGKPLDEALWDMDDVATTFDLFADKAAELDTGASVPVSLPDDRFSCSIVQEPLGVVALVTPWNYPLLARHTLLPARDSL